MINYKLGICYGSIALFNTMLHNIFLLYHVEMFVSIYKIDKMSFWIGEVVFLVWNSVNDPLFGWLSDRKYLSSDNKVEHCDVVLQRIDALRCHGPLFAIAFLAIWVAWVAPSIQFVICLCLYDGFLTMIDLHHSALLADISVSADTRTRLNAYCSVFSAFGSISVFVSYAIWNHKDLYTFQVFCFCLTAISMCGFLIASKILKEVYLKHQAPVSSPEKREDFGNTSLSVSEKDSLMKFVKELSGHRNFVWFSIMNIVQVFHCHFNSNFFPLFLDSLLGSSNSANLGAYILGISFILPHINNLYLLSLCRKYGVYRVVHWLFWFKLWLSLAMLIIGPNSIVLLSLFIASNRVFTEGTCKLLTLVVSDLVDEDYVVHCRRQAISALMFGSAALLSKPGQTLAPLIGTWLLSVHTGHDVFESGALSGTMHHSAKDSASAEAYKQGVFLLLVYIPIVCGVVQLLVWSQFTLHGKRLNWVKKLRSGPGYERV